MAVLAPSPDRIEGYPVLTPELRERAARIEQRRLALSSQNSILRARYDAVMRWVNPPWDSISGRADPRPEMALARRNGRNVIHADWTQSTMGRWAVLQMGSMPKCKVIPRYFPVPLPEQDDPGQTELDLKIYDLDRQSAINQAAQMEEQTRAWQEVSDFHRVMLWACWAKEAFGKSVVRTGWDDYLKHPTIELLENPSQCYYAWTSRYGNRRLAWMIVSDQMMPEEANFRYGIDLPLTDKGYVNMSAWHGPNMDSSEMDTRPEQMDELGLNVYADESWELVYDLPSYATEGDQPRLFVRQAFMVAGRILETQDYPWQRVPFRVLEGTHIPTYSHGASTAEKVISLNQAYDDLLDRQHTVIEFESGPRYKGLNLGYAEDKAVEMPPPGFYLPLTEGQDIQQIDARVDFWPSTVHSEELKTAYHWTTGLTPIALGMSPAAQTSGRALNAEWKAVTVPLAERLINLGPEIVDIWRDWWDFAQTYDTRAMELAQGYDRFTVVWDPLDIRDLNEVITSVIALYQANLLDPELALEKVGVEDVPETIARIRRYLTDPVWNPLRFQQMLVLKQLALSIQQQQMQVQAQQQQMQAQQQPPQQGGGIPPEQAAEQGELAAMQAAQGQAPPTDESMNQQGGFAGLDTELLLRQPVEGGIGFQTQVNPQEIAMSPTNGQVPT